jgi:tripartite-type tricarboxylate transporter receptor subunit TctC
MEQVMLRRIGVKLALGIAALSASVAHAEMQGFPTKPVHILVGAAPGGLIDLFARTYAG